MCMCMYWCCLCIHFLNVDICKKITLTWLWLMSVHRWAQICAIVYNLWRTSCTSTGNWAELLDCCTESYKMYPSRRWQATSPNDFIIRVSKLLPFLGDNTILSPCHVRASKDLSVTMMERLHKLYGKAITATLRTQYRYVCVHGSILLWWGCYYKQNASRYYVVAFDVSIRQSAGSSFFSGSSSSQVSW